MLLKMYILLAIRRKKQMRKLMQKDRLLLIAVMMILPAMARFLSAYAGGAYSSLIQKVEDTYEAEPASVSA